MVLLPIQLQMKLAPIPPFITFFQTERAALVRGELSFKHSNGQNILNVAVERVEDVIKRSV